MNESLNEVMADKVPKMQKKQHKKWMTEEILNLMEDRRKAKSNIDLYKTLNTQIKDKCNEAKEQWINEQCKEIENNLTVDIQNANTCILKSKTSKELKGALHPIVSKRKTETCLWKERMS